MRRPVHGFFYASRFMAGGVLGSRKARRLLCPLFEPGTPSAAICFEAFVGGLKPLQRSSIMNKQNQVAPIALKISDIVVRQDAQGRYCLNDLHKASGNNPNHQPTNFVRLATTKELCAEIERSSDMMSVKVVTGKAQGTYVVKELVYAYAMWISASFSLKVIRAYDALQSQPLENPEPLHDPFLTDNTYRVATQEAFNAHWNKCHADMEKAGVKSPAWPKVDDKVITGLVASMMWRGRWIVSFDNDQRMQLSPMTDHDCVVDSCNPERIKSFINCLDFDVLHSVTEAVFARVNRQLVSNKNKN
jgi:hypothetical protein